MSFVSLTRCWADAPGAARAFAAEQYDAYPQMCGDTAVDASEDGLGLCARCIAEICP